MAKSLQSQLHDAYEGRRLADGLTLEALTQQVRAAGLDISVDSVARKIRGEQSLRSYEIEVLARCLRVKVSTGKPGKAAA